MFFVAKFLTPMSCVKFEPFLLPQPGRCLKGWAIIVFNQMLNLSFIELLMIIFKGLHTTEPL